MKTKPLNSDSTKKYVRADVDKAEQIVVRCPLCEKDVKRSSLWKHLAKEHGSSTRIVCFGCLKDHDRDEIWEHIEENHRRRIPNRFLLRYAHLLRPSGNSEEDRKRRKLLQDAVRPRKAIGRTLVVNGKRMCPRCGGFYPEAMFDAHLRTMHGIKPGRKPKPFQKVLQGGLVNPR
jgi:uncharacterized C2H2 Zn-finger protein/predicted Fe-S protein YdhL (DUF1289 family)